MSNVSEEIRQRVVEVATEAARIYEEEDRFPFPYDDCRWLRDQIEVGNEFEGFAPDLSLWFSDVAGSCSWGKRILNWSEERLCHTREFAGLSFFDIHPEYCAFERLISEENTPDLYEDLCIYERMREMLLKAITLLLREEE